MGGDADSEIGNIYPSFLIVLLCSFQAASRILLFVIKSEPVAAIIIAACVMPLIAIDDLP